MDSSFMFFLTHSFIIPAFHYSGIFSSHHSIIPIFQYFGIQMDMLSTDKEVRL
jgi:hypothetical protein